MHAQQPSLEDLSWAQVTTDCTILDCFLEWDRNALTLMMPCLEELPDLNLLARKWEREATIAFTVSRIPTTTNRRCSGSKSSGACSRRSGACSGCCSQRYS